VNSENSEQILDAFTVLLRDASFKNNPKLIKYTFIFILIILLLIGLTTVSVLIGCGYPTYGRCSAFANIVNSTDNETFPFNNHLMNGISNNDYYYDNDNDDDYYYYNIRDTFKTGKKFFLF
jgi:hypothetical protein